MSRKCNEKRPIAMKIWTLFIFVSVCIVCFSAAGSGQAAAVIVYVDTDGTGNYNCDGTNDHIELNKALTYIDSVGGGTVYLRGPNTFWIDETLEIGSNTILTGDTSACIKLVSNAGWDVQVPLIKNKNDVNNNITVKGFEIDGNSGSQSVTLGAEYYNMMYFVNCTDVTVTGMRLEWGTCDGLKIRNSPYNYTFLANIKFTDNSVYKLGHDALYVLGMNGITVANNDVYTRTNSAFRLSSSGHAKIYNNVIHSEFSSSSNGPGIEIDKSSGILSAHRSENIEIYNNLFHTLYGSAIWITGEDADNVVRGKDVYIHHNIMYNVGQYPIDTGYSNAAITIGQFNNTRIENNVIDNGGHAGIKYYRYIKFYKMSSKFITTIKNNVIINCNKNVATGVWNYDPGNHKFILDNNCIYKNTNSAYVGENITHTGDIYADPLFVSSATRDYHLKSTAGHYSNGKWIVDTVSSPLIDAGCPTSAYSNEPSPNGGRINIGRYGNTAEASKSYNSSEVPNIGDTISYAPAYDNRLRDSSPTTVLSTTTYLDIGKTTATYRDVMWFDLSTYKTTDTISKATLSLYWYYPPGVTRTSDTVVEVYRPLEWSPQYVTWNSRMYSTLWDTPGGNWFDKSGASQGTTPYASVTFPAGTVPDNRYYEFDVTSLVQEYVSGKYKNTGFFIKAKTESGNYIAFYSADASNTAVRPKLTVTSTSGSAPTDSAPVANAGADKTSTVGSAVTFDASASTDDKGIASYSWDFDSSNGITSEASTVSATKTYTTIGTYTVTLTVTDTVGQKSTDTLQVVVSNPVSSISYAPLYDNRLRDLSATTVLSTTTYLDVGKSSSTCRDVMLFDLSSYKTTDTISKAILSLYWYYPAGATRTSDTIVEIYRPLEWDTKYVTWNSRMSGTPWGTAGGNWFDKNAIAQGSTPYASMTFAGTSMPDNKYYEFDVTQLVQEYVNGKYKNTGFFLKAKTESGNYIAFYSADWSNTAQRPKLTVTTGSGSVDYPPVANAGNDKTTLIGTVVTFDAGSSTDDKGIASYSWDFDASNGITADATTKIASKTYTATGIYTVTLTATDTAGQKSTDTLQVTVNPSSVDNPPVANAGADKTATVGADLTFDGSASTDDKGIASYSWNFGDGTTATGVSPTHKYATAGTYIVTLTVTDTAAQKATDTLQVTVNNAGSTVSYTPTSDNRLRSDSPTTVLSTTTYLDIGKSTPTSRDMMMFDLSNYKTTDTISKATLSLYWYYPAGKTRTSDTVVEVYRPVEWDPQYVTWNSRASGTPWSTAGGNWYDKNGLAQGSTPYASVTFLASTLPDNKYYEFDVTQLVQEYVSGKYKNTGLFLKARTESGNYIAFYSADATNAAVRPKLTVTS